MQNEVVGLRTRTATAAFALLATPAMALESAQWPPPDAVAGRMKALQEQLRGPKVTAAQRAAAHASP